MPEKLMCRAPSPARLLRLDLNTQLPKVNTFYILLAAISSTTNFDVKLHYHGTVISSTSDSLPNLGSINILSSQSYPCRYRSWAASKTVLPPSALILNLWTFNRLAPIFVLILVIFNSELALVTRRHRCGSCLICSTWQATLNRFESDLVSFLHIPNSVI